MRRLLSICVTALLPSVAVAEVVQSSQVEGALWTVTDGPTTRLQLSGVELRVELPPGATIDDLEPVRDGWYATARAPQADGTGLLLIHGSEHGNDLVAVPSGQTGRHRGRAMLVIERDELAGLVWLEGDGARELAVRAATWNGESWSEPETISPRGPGSQVSPRVSVLADGSWLLVWAAFDGSDDEILWSRRQRSVWSPPQPLHQPNDVPDILPRVIATGSGAVAIWSRFDGEDYRLQISSFVDGSWLQPSTFGGKGSGDPVVLRHGDDVWVLFHTVETRSWNVLEVDSGGRGVRLAEVPEVTYERPLLVIDERGEAALRWPEMETLDRPGLDRPLQWRTLP